MKILIKKGTHRALNQRRGIDLNIFGIGSMAALVTFTKESKYILNNQDDQDDWNKLFGKSWGFSPLFKQFEMHENSSRWVWRYNTRSNMFQISPYVYHNGIRIHQGIGSYGIINLKVDEPVFLAIVPDKDKQFVHFRYTKDIQNLDANAYPENLITLDSVYQNIPSTRGFTDSGFFGGNQTPPHTISYEFIKF